MIYYGPFFYEQRYGSHAVEISSQGYAFIPVLLVFAIFVTVPISYKFQKGEPIPFECIPSIANPANSLFFRTQRAHANTTVHATSSSHPMERLYTASQNTVCLVSAPFLCLIISEYCLVASFVDVYTIKSTTLTHLQSLSILPPSSNSDDYRGDTLRLQPPTFKSPSPTHLFATTRGFNTSHRGFLAVFRILPNGLLDSDEDVIERWQTPTSGGKANAIELKAKSRS